MKKIFVLISLLLLVSCSNYSNIEGSSVNNTYYCYKEFDKYEEYISVEYKDNIINSINYSYVFDNKISSIDSLSKYSEYIKYNNETIELVFNKSNMTNYIEVKKEIIKLFNLCEDTFEYVENGVLKNNKFRNYLKGYSCE